MPTLARLAAALAALCVLALAAPAAHADSIAYIKGGDVWLATSDGARQYQVTSTGGYSDVSQADDGSIVALAGMRIHKLDRTGKVLADFDTPVSDTRPPGQRVFYGPFDLAMSPDGSKVAYSWYYMTQSQDPTCFPPQCYTTINEAGTGYTHSDRQTGWDEPGFHKYGGWRNPVWVDDHRVLISDAVRFPNTEVTVDDRTATDNMARLWFTDDLQGNESGNMTAGDITRDTRKLAYVTGVDEESLTLYWVPNFPTEWRDLEPYPKGSAYPWSCYRYGTPSGGKFNSPTFSPTGAKLAWGEGDGIKVVDVPDFQAAGQCTVDGASQTGALLIPGGSNPDWGPADVPPARQDGGGGGGGGGDGGGRPSGAVSVAPAKAKLRNALKRGVKLRVTTPAAGSLAATATARGKRVAAAKARQVGAGAATLKLAFTKQARKSLKRAKRVKLAVSVIFTPAGGTPQVTSASVTLKR